MHERSRLAFRITTWLLLVSLGLGGPLGGRALAEEKDGAGERREDRKNDREEARAQFQHGVELFKDGDFRAALISFRRAYQLSPNYRVLYNIGQASAEAQDYPAAWEAFHRYLQEGGREVSSARRGQVEGELRKLEGRIARLTVSTNVSDAEILVDDLLAGRSPLTAPLVVGAGRRKVTVVAPDRDPQTRLVDVAGGDDLKLEISLPPPKLSNRPLPEAPQDAPLPPTEVAKPEVVAKESAPLPPPPRSIAVPVGLAVTGALAAAAVTTGIIAWRAKKDYDDTLETLDARDALESGRERTKRWALTTDILWGATVAAGVTTAILGIYGRKSEAPLRVSFSRDGLLLSGKF